MACPRGVPVPVPGALRWIEVDPALHPFDPVGLTELVRPLLPSRRPRGDALYDHGWMGPVTRALCDRLGAWASGWHWGVGEGGGGGPVTAWCCPSHSLGAPEETAPRIAAAVADWRAWIVQLDVAFRELAPTRAASESQVVAAFERAVAELIALVVARTHAEDMWYAHCEQVLTWFLERCGVADPEPLVEAAIDGRFESWVGPNDALRADVAAALGREAARRGSDG